ALNIQDGATGNTVLNNILLNRHPFRGSIDISADSLGGFRSDFNVVMDRFTTTGGDSVLDLPGWRSLTGQDANSIIAAPGELFADPDNGDYRLRPGSPAVDAGTPESAPAADFEGTARP